MIGDPRTTKDLRKCFHMVTNNKNPEKVFEKGMLKEKYRLLVKNRCRADLHLSILQKT